MKAVYFDMDGTIADLYGVEGWLDSLVAEQTKPYREAKSLVDMRKLSYELNRLQRAGYHIGIVTWLSKNSSDEYAEKVAWAKKNGWKNIWGLLHGMRFVLQSMALQKVK